MRGLRIAVAIGAIAGMWLAWEAKKLCSRLCS